MPVVCVEIYAFDKTNSNSRLHYEYNTQSFMDLQNNWSEDDLGEC